MKKTKFLCALLAAALVLSLCSCSNGSGDSNNSSSNGSSGSETSSGSGADSGSGSGSGGSSSGSGGSGSGGGQQGGGGNSTSVPYTKVGTQTINGVSYDIVEFGHYPQSEKAAGVTITNEGNPVTINGASLYTGSDGAYYTLVNSNSTYYKVEPIRWRVLTENYDHDSNDSTPGKKLLLAEKILEPMKFYDNINDRTIGESTVYPNNYQHSKIRAYLNGLVYKVSETDSNALENKGFLQRAFTSDEQAAIATTTVVNKARSTNPDANAQLWNSGTNQYASNTPTSDKIFLLSEQEVTKSEYGFAAWASATDSTRIRKPTDFAKASGTWTNTSSGYEGNGYWWLRSPSYYDSGSARDVIDNGNADNSYDPYVNIGRIGVVPALCLN